MCDVKIEKGERYDGAKRKLKIFISYSHLDEENINDFRKHIAPLKSNNLIEDWTIEK